MTAYLLEHPNPHGPHFYKTRVNPVTLGVIHTSEQLPDLDGADSGAENLLKWAAATDRAVSWHDTSDSDSRVFTLPYTHTAFHVRNYNSRSVGLEIATRAHLWGDLRADYVTGALEEAALAAADWVDAYDLPIRRLTRAQADAGLKGFIDHAALDPDRRTDPGRAFDWTRFLRLVAAAVSGDVAEPAPKPEGERRQHAELLQFGDRGPLVRDWQRRLKRWNADALPRSGDDGHFGGETRDWTRRFQKLARIADDGRVGPVTDRAMHAALAGGDVGEPGRVFDPGAYPGRLLTQPPPTRGAEVKTWQTALNAWRPRVVKVDGVYGPITAQWTRTFQRAAGVTADGVVGPRTWGVMRAALR